MGNALVCVPHSSRYSCSSRPARLVNGVTGQVQQMQAADAVQVAELMLDNPCAFVMPLHLHHTPHSPSSPAAASYFTALPADHHLQPGGIYLLLPMHKLHKRTSLQELSYFARLAEAAHPPQEERGKARRMAGFSGQTPPAEGDRPYPSTMAGLSTLIPPPLFDPAAPSTPRSMSWKPTLHTISEAAPPSRPPHGYAKQLVRLLSKGSPHRPLVNSLIPTC
ncbi:hypothetical protein L7F22_011526 [Adiantum nelumboides]|nr:hypothetical protein [Adiantum nelumboides]